MLRIIVCFLLLITEVYAEQRVALVIGNCLYDPTKSLEDDKSRNLPNACKDALLIKESLVGKKFEVLYRENLNTQELKQALIDFKNALPKGAIGWFYYAGHAMQHESINYLIPVRTEINCDLLNSELLKTVAVQDVLNEMQGKNIAVKIIQLDACRDNPLEKCPLRGAFNTLASMNNVPQGSIIGFSTAPGTRAFDASGYAKEIALAIQEYSHLPVEQMLKQAHKKISSQTSWLHTSVSGNDLCLDQCEEVDKAKILQVELQEKEKILQERDKIIFELKQQVADAQKNQVNPQILIDLMKRLETLEKDKITTPQPIQPPPPVDCWATKEHQKVCRDKLLSGNEAMEMVILKGGNTNMGSGLGEKSEQPVHKINIKPFALGKYEITKGEFAQFVEKTSYQTDAEKAGGCKAWTGNKWETKKEFNWRNVAFEQTNDHPVLCVSWNDAMAYVKWLAKETAKKYRLPTEAEWEYAARAGTTKSFSFGDCLTREQANFNAEKPFKNCPIGTASQQTVSVTNLKPNNWGLFHLHGNAWEWVQDSWHNNYKNAPKDSRAWQQTTFNKKVQRGGSWKNVATSCRSSYRTKASPDGRGNDIGFRVARDLD